MSDLRDLYQEVILDHSKRPRNFHRPDGANRQALGYNALCGDRITVYVRLEDGVLRAVGFEGQGCAICTASASVMTESVSGKNEDQTRVLYHGFHELVTGDPTRKLDASALGKAGIFADVAELPMRVKCATLPWHTLEAALKGSEDAVSTE